MKRYDSYKDSSVQWIGEIPSHWDIIPFRYMTTQLLTGLNPRDNFKLTLDDEIFYVTIKNFKDGVLYLDENCDRINKQAWEIIQSRSDLQVGDILFASISRNGQAYIIREEPKNWNINESVFKIRPDFKKTISSFLYFCITNDGFFNEMFSESTGSTFKSIKQNKLKAMQLPLPPLAEQEMIVRHLDVKCGEIDKLIATQQRRIELLQELRQSIITRAVTRGINPDAPLRDSGIDWIGQVPTHWEIRRIKSICKSEKYSIKTGPFGSQLKGQDLMLDGDVRVYNQRNVIDNDFDDIHFFVTKEKAIELDSFYTHPQDLLITSRGTIGKCSILPADVPMGLLHPCLIALRINQAICDLDWAHIFISSSSCFSTNIFLNSNATTIEVIYTDTLKNVSMPLPPLSEQREIVTHIKHETAKVDHALQQAERQIELLQELRQSVITEVVTGKRKVC